VAILVTVFLSLAVRPALGGDPVVNEFVVDHIGSDTHEFIEILGDPDMSYPMLAVLEIEGDVESNPGRVDGIYPVGTTDGGGYWTTGFLANELENGTLTLLLVEDFYGSVGDDLDLDDNGGLDVTPFQLIVDDVAVTDDGIGDQTYSLVVLAAGFDGDPYRPGGASRIPNGQDMNTIGDWFRNDFSGAGLPGFPGTPEPGEALNTPGEENREVTVGTDAVINEFVFDHIGSDNHEFVEVFGEPSASYASFTVLEIEGDVTSNPGRVDGIYTVFGTDGAGFWTTGYLAGEFENGTVTLLLVEDFTGSFGDDIDMDDDGTIDTAPFLRVVDDVGVTDGDAGDWVYSDVVLGPGYDENPLKPGGASRIPNGVDTNTAADWLRNDFSGAGLPGFEGTPVIGEALNTFGDINKAVGAVAVKYTTWGGVKALYQ
jgi:hypothetical protein